MADGGVVDPCSDVFWQGTNDSPETGIIARFNKLTPDELEKYTVLSNSSKRIAKINRDKRDAYRAKVARSRGNHDHALEARLPSLSGSPVPLASVVFDTEVGTQIVPQRLRPVAVDSVSDGTSDSLLELRRDAMVAPVTPSLLGSAQKDVVPHEGLDWRYLERYHNKLQPFEDEGLTQADAAQRFSRQTQSVSGGRKVPAKVHYEPHCQVICLEHSSPTVLDMRARLLEAFTTMALSAPVI